VVWGVAENAKGVKNWAGSFGFLKKAVGSDVNVAIKASTLPGFSGAPYFQNGVIVALHQGFDAYNNYGVPVPKEIRDKANSSEGF